MGLQISTLDSVLSYRSVDGEPIFADALNKIRIRIVVGVLLTVLKGTQKSIIPCPFQWLREQLQNAIFLSIAVSKISTPIFDKLSGLELF